MKYKCYRKVEKDPKLGGDYWREADFTKHLNLTYFQTTFSYLLKNYPPPKKILEAGCGIGRWVIPLTKEKYDVTGIEIEKEAIDIIKRNYPDKTLTLIHGDIFNMEFPDSTFDVVLSLGVLEHFENYSIQVKAINEHKRVLKEGGVLLITVPYFSIFRALFHVPYKTIVSLVRKLRGETEFFTEYRYRKSTFKKIIERNNLKVIDVVFDELLPPYNFGLTVGSPISKYFVAKDGVQYKLNNFGIRFFKTLWEVHPCLISGGVGYVCRKKNDKSF